MGLKVLLKNRNYYASLGPQPIQIYKDMHSNEKPRKWIMSGTIQTWESEEDCENNLPPNGSVTVYINLDSPPNGNIVDMIYAKYKSTLGDYVDDISVTSK